MMKFLIRNDDVGFQTTLDEIRQFCQICDKYGYRILQAITPMGECRKLDRRMTNDQIKAFSRGLFSENKEVVEYLRARNDLVGIHGLRHTHVPTEDEIVAAKSILQDLGLNPTYFVPPFNEGNYGEEIAGLRVSKLSMGRGERLEDFLDKGRPVAEVMYLHSWRFDNDWYAFGMLERCLQRLANKGVYKESSVIKLNLGCKRRKLPGFDNLDKIYGWLFQDGLSQYASGIVDGITISHALMFLNDSELKKFMMEMRRVLKVGGVVRITEDNTENPRSDMYQTGCMPASPQCLTGPEMMRRMLEEVGFTVYDVDRKTTHFYDKSLMQAYRGGPPGVFFIEGVKGKGPPSLK